MLRSSIRYDFYHVLCIAKTLELLNKILVYLGQMQFLLAVRQVLQVDEVSVRHIVRVFEKLVLLQINLQGLRIWKIIKRFLEFNKVLHTLKTALHPV